MSFEFYYTIYSIFMKTIYLIFFFIVFSSCTSRKKIEKGFTYNDDYGNIILFEQNTKLPKGLDIINIKSALNGNSFNKNEYDTIIKFKYYVEEIKKTNIKNEYTFRILTIPKTDNDTEITKYLGYTHYKFKVKKNEKTFDLVRLNESPYNEL